MTLSRGQIRKRIGFDLKEKFNLYHSRNVWPMHGERGSGRTIDGIISVLHALQSNPKCAIVAHTQEYAEQLKKDILRYAELAGIDASKVRVTGVRYIEQRLRGRNYGTFKDHHAGGNHDDHKPKPWHALCPRQ